MFETDRTDGVLQVARPGTRWLATGPGGGYRTADAAYNLTVPEGFDRTDLPAYVAERRAAAGFETEGPAMLTGVDLRHARQARLDPVSVVATAGLSNPAALSMPDGDPPDGRERPASRRRDRSTGDAAGPEADSGSESGPDPGTVNLVVGTARALSDGALATLLATAVEAKTATLVAETGFTGTTSDAAVVGCDPDGGPAEFAGSATAVGRATRICVRDAIRASLASRYGERADSDTDGANDRSGPALPASVVAAEFGSVTRGRASVSALDD